MSPEAPAVLPRAATRPAGFHALRVAEVRRETEDAVSLAFDVPAGLRGAFGFVPGQYLTLRVRVGGEEVRRSYSICSGPGEALRVAVKRVGGGVFSGWAHEVAAAGHVVEALPPEGRFVLPPGARRVLAVAAGSGITPVLAMLKALLAGDGEARAVLVYGSRNTAGILFREELEWLKDRFLHRFSVVHVLSREQQDIPVLNGRIDGAKLAAVLPALMPGGAEAALVCGPGEMIDAVTRHLVASGMDPALVLSERFTTGAEPVRARPASKAEGGAMAIAVVRADGASTEVSVRDGETVLEAALRAGLDLPWSCRGGMCSTCRARVTEGAVEMAVNYGLEPWETAAGYALTCQARPTTARVVVDYDHV